MSISSLGVGSGLDLESLVEQLLQSERGPKTQRLDERDESLSDEISAVGQVKSKLSEFEDAIKELQQEGNLSGREPTIENPSEDNDVLSANPSTAALPGTYEIAVTQLAQGSRIETANAVDGGFASSDDVVLTSGTADITFKIGDTDDTFTLSISEGTTLAELREQINNDENNFGVQANIINTGTADGGARLVFTSDITGVGNDLQIVNNSDIAELNRISTTDSSESSTLLSPIKNAANAIAVVDGIEVQSDTNKFENTIQSVRFDVKELSDQDTNGDPIASRLIIGFDAEGLEEKITEFVDKFNELNDDLARLTSYGESDLEEDGALAGDSTVRGIQSGLANILSSNVSDSLIGSLFALGIELTSEGKLEISTTDFGLGSGADRLENALNDNFDDIDKLFNGEGGIASRILEFTEQYTQSSGILSSREDNIKDLQDVVTSDRERFEIRMISFEQTLRSRYLSLDSTVARLQQTGNALFAALS
ncbi:flagellar filament capping protein FliD [Glaciecola petra]|uniref:Flagellar hook-associated protein 2 n=1 Tax=Glaciecola petra TaxID=3075602 RepID=A0ABU2ZP16_9ALTE|nr:flagellar filament capping protein FliD [Aestuariibacter sp. P117]MDT0593798.1 flagellar filament capping protein FliD [Aestuariibacter sp. P117]